MKLGADLREDAFRIPHPCECDPWRPGRAPDWQPRRDRRDAGNRPIPRSTAEGWHSPRLRAADDTGHVRINFNYRNIFTTAAGYGEKPRRAQYFEGPYELALFRLLEVLPSVVDYQFQPLQMLCTTSAGALVTYTTDVAYLMQDGRVFLEEVKATRAYFDDSETEDLLAMFEDQILRTGAIFHRRIGRGLAEPVFWRTVKDAFDDRRTAFDEGDVGRVHSCIERSGGAAAMAEVLTSLRAPGRQTDLSARENMVALMQKEDIRRKSGARAGDPLFGQLPEIGLVTLVGGENREDRPAPPPQPQGRSERKRPKPPKRPPDYGYASVSDREEPESTRPADRDDDDAADRDGDADAGIWADDRKD